MDLELARDMAVRYMDSYGLHGWSFGFDRAVRRFGFCDYGKKHISMSRHLVEMNDEADVKDTILHEIAHALAPPGEGHSEVWKAVAKTIGARPERTCSEQVKTPDPKWALLCVDCGYYHGRHRRTRGRRSCRQCGGGTFNENYLLTWVPYDYAVEYDPSDL